MVIFGLSVPSFVLYAHETGSAHVHNVIIDDGGEVIGEDGKVKPASGGKSITLDNPLGNNINDIPSLVNAILDIVITIGVPIIVIAIIFAGFQFIAAQGDPKKLEKAKKTLLYVLIGAGILLAAWAIAQAVVSTVAAIRGK